MRNLLLLSFVAAVCGAYCLPLSAQYAGFMNANGGSPFSDEFRTDYKAATELTRQTLSAEPLLKLLQKYNRPEEQAELEVTIGLAYGQWTGIVDYSKAVPHFTNALKFKLPERTYIEILMWRGNSLEGINRYNDSLKDYLRGLLACSYHDLSSGWPEVRSFNLPILSDPPDPAIDEANRDNLKYREAIDFQRFLLDERYYFVDAVKRIRSKTSVNDEGILRLLKELSPDTTRYDSIIQLLKSKNQRPRK